MADEVYADLLDNLSPLTKAGIDPDDARMDRAGAMAKLMGTDSSAPAAPWYQQPDDDDTEPQQAQQAKPQQVSPNGNPLPAGLQSRQPQPVSPGMPGSGTEPGPDEVSGAGGGTAVPGSVTPDGDATAPGDAAKPDLAAGNARTIAQMQSDYQKASADVDAMSAQPDLAEQTKVLEQQRVNAQRRQVELQSPNDKTTGKMLPEYKPSFGQRVMRGVAGVRKGGIIGGINPEAAGATAYGAPNKDFAIDQQQAAGAVAGIDQQLQNAAANYKATSEWLAKVRAERRALATSGKDVTGASIEQQKVPISQQQADTETQRAKNESPDAKAQLQRTEYDQLKKKADDIGLKGGQRTIFLANGKLPDPKQATAEEIALGQATAAWHRDNPGKQPGLEDVRSIRAAASGSEVKGGDKTTNLSPSGWQSLVNEHDKEYKDAQSAKDAELKDAKNNPIKAEAIKAKYEGIATNLQDRWNQRYAEADPEGKYAKGAQGAAVPQQPTAQAKPPAKPSPATHPIGTIISVGGKPMKITGYNPTTGKAIVEPQ